MLLGYNIDLSSKLLQAGAGDGDGSSRVLGEAGSSGGGALFSPRFSSSHLSISSDRPTNGLLPSNLIISSLKGIGI